MRSSAIRSLKGTLCAPIIAAARFERTVQIWNWNTGECRCEFDTISDFDRLSLSPSGDYLVAANWAKGRLGGVACYRTTNGEKLWHRLDIRRTQRMRFATDGAAIWCGIEGGPLQILDAQTGATIRAMRAGKKVFDSPYSSHLLVVSRQKTLIKNTKDVEVPKLSSWVLDASFSPAALCLSEASSVVRCIDLNSGMERWRYEPPKGHHVIFLSYNQHDHCFYGTQWFYEHGGPVQLLRIREETGNFETICNLDTFADGCCFGDGVLVTSSGDVVSLVNGQILRRLAFPQRDYPDDSNCST